MTPKRLTIAVNTAMVISLVLSVVLGAPLAGFIYFRFMHKGPVQDVAPGDGIGLFLVWMMVAVFAWVGLLFVWARLYRTVLRRQ